MKTIIPALILLASVSLLRADQTIQNVQQALKDQGFYYGTLTGEKNADTIAAIRRYQIRNGLQVTGELDDETLRALGVGKSSHSVAKTRPSATPETADSRTTSREEAIPASPTPAELASTRPPDREVVYPSRATAATLEGGDLFARTPYETASPEVQRNVVLSAQRSLAQRGLYRDELDGIYGPSMAFSLRAYQARAKLPVTGRLDLETLAALRLLPGANTPVYVPHRRFLRERPVRGEWIRE